MQQDTPEPFTIAVANEVLTDLRERLSRTRWPDQIPGTAWEYGTNLDYLKELVSYWLSRYDWRAHERRLNELNHQLVTIDDVRVHFIHERGRGPYPFPLIMSHGWPGSFVEFLKIIPMLTDPASFGGDPEDAFDLVIPSLPGYGFSGPTRERGVGVARIADVFDRLMSGVLGYSRYGAQGGDWGAIISSRLGFAFPQHVAGIHINLVSLTPHPDNRTDLTDAETAWLAAGESWRTEETGYSEIQGTKPQTLAYGLTDSPAGLAAWIVEKFRTWSDCDGNVERSFSRDELLTNVMIYWLTETINSSTRLYFERRHSPWLLGRDERVEVPTGVAAFPKEIRTPPPRSWAERCYNVQHWTDMPRGGHFAAMEQPELLADDIRAFFRPLRA